MPLPERAFVAAAGAAAVIIAASGGWLLLAATPAAIPVATTAAAPAASGATVVDPAPATELVVDVEGGVVEPGIHRLAPGARVADAIAAAGGYAPQADLVAAATALNLARPLADGEQLWVPVIGLAPAGAGPAPSSATALVDLNTASPEALDALPGIGPVTVQKIVAARTERPFASLEDAVERDVLTRGQLEKIRDLASAG